MLLLGCKGGEERKQAGEVVPPSKELAAEVFYQDYARLVGKDVLTRYAEGVLVTGKVAEVVEMGEPEGMEVAMEAAAGQGISIRFADGGAAARRRKVAAGGTLTVRCRVGGKPAGVIFLLDCVVP